MSTDHAKVVRSPARSRRRAWLSGLLKAYVFVNSFVFFGSVVLGMMVGLQQT